MDVLADLQRRIAILERQVRFANKPITATVTANNDPEGRNRIKVSCADLYGDNGESPWLVSRSAVNGNNIGEVWTPKIGSQVTIMLRNGNPDAGEYFGGARDENSTIPEEFADVNVNGLKTESGICEIFDDNVGKYVIRTEQGKVVIQADGRIDVYGGKVNIHAPTDLNSDAPLFGIVTDNFICPVIGKNIIGSTTCKAAI